MRETNSVIIVCLFVYLSLFLSPRFLYFAVTSSSLFLGSVIFGLLGIQETCLWPRFSL